MEYIIHSVSYAVPRVLTGKDGQMVSGMNTVVFAVGFPAEIVGAGVVSVKEIRCVGDYVYIHFDNEMIMRIGVRDDTEFVYKPCEDEKENLVSN